MGVIVQARQKDFDTEWFELILKAKEMGLTIEEIRHFFVSSPKEQRTPNIAYASN